MCSARRCSPSCMGKTRVIAETGAGQHGVATATACALLGLECVVYMGEVDTRRQALNVARMRLLGAEVVPVTLGLAHAQGRDQRGAARLGDPRRHHALPARDGRGPAPVPDDGARLPPGDRPGGPRAGAGAHRAAARRDRGVRRRRVERDRHLPRVPRRPRRAARRLRARRRRRRDRAARRDPVGGLAGRAARRDELPAAGRRRPDGRVVLDLGGAGLPGRRAGARAAQGPRAGRSTGRSPTPRRWTPSRCSAAPRGSSRRSRARTPSRARWSWAASSARTR